MAYLVICSRYFYLHQPAKIPEMSQTIHRNHDRRPWEPSGRGDLRPSFIYLWGGMPKETLWFYIAIWVRLVTIWCLSSPQEPKIFGAVVLRAGRIMVTRPWRRAQASGSGNLFPSLNICRVILQCVSLHGTFLAFCCWWIPIYGEGRYRVPTKIYDFHIISTNSADSNYRCSSPQLLRIGFKIHFGYTSSKSMRTCFLPRSISYLSCRYHFVIPPKHSFIDPSSSSWSGGTDWLRRRGHVHKAQE